MFNVTFTDVYGMALVDTPMEITNASFDSNCNINESGGARNVSENYRLNFSASYWVSQAAKDAGSRPLTFRPGDGLSTNKSYTESPDTSDLKVLAQAVLEEEILPAMQ